MVTEGLERGSRVLRLDGDHPAADLVRNVLAELGGFPVPPRAKKSGAQPTIIYPLAALYPVSFRILLQLIVAEEPLDIATLRRRLPDYFQNSIVNTTTRLLRDRVLVRDRRGCISLSETLPPSLPALVLAIADYLAVEDPRLADRPTVKGVRPAAFLGSDDGAPRLFGSDLRLRNLMALAVHGPMLHVELRRIVGNPKILGEDEGNAPFGRAALVREWETPEGRAVALDDAHPLALPLRRLLIRLSEIYPLAAYVPRFDPPKMHKSKGWSGDRHVIFGGVLPTSILLSIGVFGWTYEALVCKIVADRARENVREAFYRMEEQGLLQADRPRGPGFNARVVTISEAFPAKAELTAVLKAHIKQWPTFRLEAEEAMRSLPPRSKAHLRKRGLWPYDS
jgi:hypothetical protein